MALLEGAMDLSLDAFRELKAAPDQWIGIEAALTVPLAANVAPVGVTGVAIHIARDSVSTGDLFIDRKIESSKLTLIKLMD